MTEDIGKPSHVQLEVGEFEESRRGLGGDVNEKAVVEILWFTTALRVLYVA